MKRQEHTVHSDRHVSPHVLSADCYGKYTNAAATLPSRSAASRGGEPFFRHDRDLNPPPSTPLGWFFGQLADVILGGSPRKLTWQVDLTSCHLSSNLKGAGGDGDKSTWQAQSSWLVKFHLCSTASVGPWICKLDSASSILQICRLQLCNPSKLVISKGQNSPQDSRGVH